MLLRDSFLGLVGIIIFLLIWSAFSYWIDDYTIPSPYNCFYYTLQLLGSEEFISHVSKSISRLVLGVFLGAMFGLAFTLLIAGHPITSAMTAPLIGGLAPVPPIVWSPILIILFGIGNNSKIALISIGCFLMVSGNCFIGYKQMPQKYLSLAKKHNKNHISILFNVVGPYLMPSFLSSVVASLGVSWVLLIASEIMISDGGIGWYIWDRRMYGDYNAMYSSIIILGGISNIILALVNQLQKKVCSWHEKQ